MAGTTRRVLNKLQLPEAEQGDRWSNEEILPVPPERQKWGPIQYIELWFLVNMNLSSYGVGSSLMATGLTYWQAIIVIIIGNVFAACFAVVNSISGAQSHIGFPIVSRSVWGMCGSYFPILNRILMSVVWYGVQAVFGGGMIYVCLRSIWMNIDERIPNRLPENIGITSARFLGYFLFNLVCAVLIWARPQQLRPYFHAASVIVGTTLFILLGWAVGTTNGWGTIISAKSSVPATELGWTMSAGIMSVIGSIASGILNQNDFTRFAKKPSDVTWTQAISYTLSANVTAIIGVLVTAATQERYGKGKPLWNPTDLFTAIQDQHGAGGRAAAFFLGLVFIVSQVSINVVGNVLAGGLDVAAVLPKYINLRRGAYTIAILSVLPNPWQQLASGSTFLAVMGAYAVFLGPMIGLLIVHYYIIQERTFHFPDLYCGDKRSCYWYFHGWNWRTVVAWVVAVIPSMPGFVHDANPKLSVPVGLGRVYSISFILGFVIAVLLALLLHWLFPVHYPEVSELEHEQELRGIEPEHEELDQVEVTREKIGKVEVKNAARS